jgi:hypothetical protein
VLQADVVERVPFLLMGLELPPTPLFKDALEKNIIPQVCFHTNDEVICMFNWEVAAAAASIKRHVVDNIIPQCASS